MGLESKVIDVSIVIVSWNAKSLLLQCLASIKNTSGDLSYETIVVDNASSDGSPEAVQTEFPEVRIVKLERNLGFAKANNIGIDLAGGRYFCLINSDVVVHEECFQTLLKYMNLHAEVGMLAPRLLNADGSHQPSCRRFPSLLNHLKRACLINTSLIDEGFFSDHPKCVECLSGAFWFIRRETVANVGKLDEAFFFYGEDMDWCKRIRQAGWDIVYLPTAEAVHFGGGSSSADPWRFLKQMQTAQLQLWRKHYSRLLIPLFIGVSIVGHVLRFALYGLVYLARPKYRARALEKCVQHGKSLRWLIANRS